MRFVRALLLATCSVVALAACADEGLEESDAQDLTSKGGILGMAPTMGFGKKVSGSIGGGQIDVWAIDLKGGDKITMVEQVTSGDLAPDFSLFFGASSKVSSKTFKTEKTKLTKTYVIESTGRHYVGVAAFKGQGSGDYTLLATCNGGPCKGEPVVTKLDEEQAGECVRMARECAFGGMGKFNGAVGPATARNLFEDCLEASMLKDEGLSCANACDTKERQEVCDGIIGIIPFYADQSATCIGVLNDCIDVCYDGGGEGLVQGPEDICLLNGFNSTCDSYARGHEACGGTYADDSVEQCHALCEATFGAWNDDLDTICVEDCGDLPE